MRQCDIYQIPNIVPFMQFQGDQISLSMFPAL